jgi:hypothetical protein
MPHGAHELFATTKCSRISGTRLVAMFGWCRALGIGGIGCENMFNDLDENYLFGHSALGNPSFLHRSAMVVE